MPDKESSHAMLRGRVVGQSHDIKVECWADCTCGFHAEGSIEHVRDAIKAHTAEVAEVLKRGIN